MLKDIRPASSVGVPIEPIVHWPSRYVVLKTSTRSLSVSAM